MKSFFVCTNADGCIIGDYYAEEIKSSKKAKKILKRVRHGDPDAFIIKFKKRREVNANKKRNRSHGASPGKR